MRDVLPSPLKVTLRVLVAGALVLMVVGVWGTQLAQVLLVVIRVVFEFLDDQFVVKGLEVAQLGPDSVFKLTVNLSKPILIGGRMTLPDGNGWLQVTTTVGSALQAPAVASTLLLAWPVSRLRNALWRGFAAIPVLSIIFLVDCPFTLWAYLWDMFVKAYEPGRFSPLLIWKDFLINGGHLAIGSVSAVLVLYLTNSLFVKETSESTFQTHVAVRNP